MLDAYSESCSCFYIIKIDVEDRENGEERERGREKKNRTNEARNIILHKYTIRFNLAHHLFLSSFFWFFSSSTTTDRVE